MMDRPVRIANCSGAASDPGYQLLRQAVEGPVDFITGDYLAEMNIADLAVAQAEGKGAGWAPTAWDGIEQSISVIEHKGIKVVLNGGAHNPEGLAKKIQELVSAKFLALTVAWVSGDDLLSKVQQNLDKGVLPNHLDASNSAVTLPTNAKDLLKPDCKLVTANAYLGARGIVKALEAGADIIICGRVADASPVIGAAWYWHGWKESDYDRLAGALIAGHLIECSAYLTGGNFSGFDELPLEDLIDLPFGICEIDHDGGVVVTKHDGTKGIVNVDTVKAQLLYELQGTAYLNSDVTAHLANINVEQVGKDRVQVTGIKGSAPPPTTKLTVFYASGFESQLLLNANGYGIEHKLALFKRQLNYRVEQMGLADKFSVLEVQQIGTPQYNPPTQALSTVYFRVLAQADEAPTLLGLWKSFADFGMQHFSGMHFSLDFRTALPRPIMALWPGLVPQSSLEEQAHIIRAEGVESISAGHPSTYASPAPRESYDASPLPNDNTDDLETVLLGSIALARSGDKAGNINIGLWTRTESDEAWQWFTSYLSRAKLISLIGSDWDPARHHIERVEMARLHAVHFVLYGVLGRGVSSATVLDSLGKGFADYVRAKEVQVPRRVLEQIRRVEALPLPLA